jgi:hypothetical protein
MPYKDKEVQRLYDQKKYQRNREKILQRAKQYASTHKEHIAEYQKEYEEKNREELNAYVRKWHKTKQTEESKEKQREARRQWMKRNKEKKIRQNRLYRLRHEERYVAHFLLNDALSRGYLIKPKTCSKCGAGGRIHGHHADYLKPLEVVWLCHSCHLKAHDGRFGNS